MAYVSNINVQGESYAIRDSGARTMAAKNATDITSANSNIEKIKTDISNTNSKLAALSNTVNANWKRRNKIKSRKFFFIGDSYGFGYTPNEKTEKGWFYWVAQYLGLQKNVDYWTVPYSVNIDQSGYGMAAVDIANKHLSWTTVLGKTDTTDIPLDEITDVVIFGGTNDTGEFIQYIASGMASLDAKIRNMFPNANISCGVLSNGGYKYFTAESGIKGMYKEYEKCTAYGWNWLPNTIWSCHRRQYISSDSIHLTKNGYRDCSKYLAQAIAFGACDVIFSDHKVPTNESSPTISIEDSAELHFKFINGIIFASQKRGQDDFIANNMTIKVPKSGVYKIADSPDFMYSDNTTLNVQTIEISNYRKDGNVRFAEIYAVDKTLWINVRCEVADVEGYAYFFGQCQTIDCWL